MGRLKADVLLSFPSLGSVPCQDCEVHELHALLRPEVGRCWWTGTHQTEASSPCCCRQSGRHKGGDVGRLVLCQFDTS